VSEVNAAQATLLSRARHLRMNSCWAVNGIQAWKTALIGAGIVPAPASEHWAAWVKNADADGRTDWYGLSAMAVEAMVCDGECFLLWVGDKLRLIPSEMVDPSDTRTLSNGHHIVAGVEFNAAGERVAYWVSPSKPTDLYPTHTEAVRIEAADVIHLYVPAAIGAVRGVTWLASVILRLAEFDQLEDARVVQQKVAAMHCAFLVDMNGTAENPYKDELQSMEPGTMIRLGAGLDVKFPTLTAAAQGAAELASLQLRGVAAGMGLPEFVLTGDMRGANYSSMRAALVTWRERIAQIQWQTIIPVLCAPVYQRVTIGGPIEEIGNVPEFYPPALPWVDPAKDAEAEATLISSGLKSRSQAVAERGYDIEQLDREIQQDHAREARLGLQFGAAPKPEAKPSEKKESEDA